MKTDKITTRSFEVVKKNRKYFAARTKGYDCKIVIDDLSRDLEPGEYDLMVEDISVRSKYGTDLIFRLTHGADEVKTAGVTTLRHHCYNAELVEQCRNLGGRWDSDEKAWIFSKLVDDKVEELDAFYNDNLQDVEITFPNGLVGYAEPASLGGYTIAKATGRDSGAELGDGVYLIDGFITSGGSMKNWLSKVSEGAVIRMKMPQAVVDDLNEISREADDNAREKITITIL